MEGDDYFPSLNQQGPFHHSLEQIKRSTEILLDKRSAELFSATCDQTASSVNP